MKTQLHYVQSVNEKAVGFYLSMKSIYIKTWWPILLFPFLHKVHLDRIYPHCFIYYKFMPPFEK